MSEMDVAYALKSRELAIGARDRAIAELREQLTTTREIARELAEALESVTTWAGRDNRRLYLSWADKIHSINVASAAINKARAAGILNAPEAPDSLPPAEVWWY